MERSDLSETTEKKLAAALKSINLEAHTNVEGFGFVEVLLTPYHARMLAVWIEEHKDG